MQLLRYISECVIFIAIFVAIEYLLGEELTTIIITGLCAAPFVILFGIIVISIIIWALSCLGDE